MSNVSEIWKQLRTDLLADTTLVGSSGFIPEVDGIYRAYPAEPKKKPFLILNADNLNAQNQISGVGVYRPSVSLDIVLLNPWDAEPIFNHLEQNWDIPKSRTGVISSGTWSINLLQFTDLIEVPGRLAEVSSGEHVRQFTIPMNVRIVGGTA